MLVGQAATPVGLAAHLVKHVPVESATTSRRAHAIVATAVVSPTNSRPTNQPAGAVVSYFPFVGLTNYLGGLLLLICGII